MMIVPALLYALLSFVSWPATVPPNPTPRVPRAQPHPNKWRARVRGRVVEIVDTTNGEVWGRIERAQR